MTLHSDAASLAPAAPTALVIDDEDYVADMIAMALELGGYTVHVAYNGRDGLARATSAPSDVIVIDIMMPYLNGEDLARQLRDEERTRDVPIVLISAGARPRGDVSGVEFVAKPFDVDDLVALIDSRVTRANEGE